MVAIKEKLDTLKGTEGLIKESEIEKLPIIMGLAMKRASAKQPQVIEFTKEELASPTLKRKKALSRSVMLPNGGSSRLSSIAPSDGNAKQMTAEEAMRREQAIQAFAFLSKEIEWNDYRFEPEVIEDVHELILDLKEQYDEVEKMTIQINKRELLLTVEKTEFKELRQVYDELKPIVDLWSLASKFNLLFPTWLEGKFEYLDAESIDINVSDWSNELKRMSKNSFVQSAPK